MSNELTTGLGQVPDYLKDYQSDTGSDLVTQMESYPRISIRGKQFRFKKEGEEKALDLGVNIEVVILAADPPGKLCAKSWFEKAYDPDSDDPPDCSSSNGVAPDSWVVDPACSNCAQCPNNAWGTATDQQGNPTKGKACNDVKRLIVILPQAINGDPWIFQVPPSSLKALSKYGRELEKHNLGVETIATRIFFVDSEFPQVDFAPSGYLQQELGQVAIARSKSEDIASMLHLPEPVTYTPTPAQEEQKDDSFAQLKQYQEQQGQQEQVTMDDAMKAGDGVIANSTPELSELEKALAEVERLKGPQEDVMQTQPTETTQQRADPYAKERSEGWDPAYHTLKPTKNADGVTWRRGRGKPEQPGQGQTSQTTEVVHHEAGTKVNPDATSLYEQTEEAPVGGPLDDILGDWGV
jgi:hypothetical protein